MTAVPPNSGAIDIIILVIGLLVFACSTDPKESPVGVNKLTLIYFCESNKTPNHMRQFMNHNSGPHCS